MPRLQYDIILGDSPGPPDPRPRSARRGHGRWPLLLLLLLLPEILIIGLVVGLALVSIALAILFATFVAMLAGEVWFWHTVRQPSLPMTLEDD